jgi:oxidase EvaA
MRHEAILPAPALEGLRRWLAERRKASELSVRRIPFRECERWSFRHGCLEHESGRFFSVVGVACVEGPAHLGGLSQAMIDQPEIGILGFVVRHASTGWQWLLQAKTEPGTVGGTQIGPSVQATRSNYMRVHGGRPTRMLELFTEEGAAARPLTDVEQSEQGDRFLGKYNRNQVVEVDPGLASLDEAGWRWSSAAEVRTALHADFLVNTDARSVLASADWSLFADPGQPGPFARWGDGEGLGARLRESLACEGGQEALAAFALLEKCRRRTPVRIEQVALDALPGWALHEREIHPRAADRDSRVQAFAVRTRDREVTSWCQPLLTNGVEGRVALLCARLDGALRFLLNASFELGLKEGAQFTASWVSGAGHGNPEGVAALLDDPASRAHASVLQSDEGGRFMNSIARYELIEVDPAAAREVAGDVAWVSLAALRAMIARRGALTNELRSSLSLLLAWA